MQQGRHAAPIHSSCFVQRIWTAALSGWLHVWLFLLILILLVLAICSSSLPLSSTLGRRHPMCMPATDTRQRGHGIMTPRCLCSFCRLLSVCQCSVSTHLWYLVPKLVQPNADHKACPHLHLRVLLAVGVLPVLCMFGVLCLLYVWLAIWDQRLYVFLPRFIVSFPCHWLHDSHSVIWYNQSKNTTNKSLSWTISTTTVSSSLQRTTYLDKVNNQNQTIKTVDRMAYGYARLFFLFPFSYSSGLRPLRRLSSFHLRYTISAAFICLLQFCLHFTASSFDFMD